MVNWIEMYEMDMILFDRVHHYFITVLIFYRRYCVPLVLSHTDNACFYSIMASRLQLRLCCAESGNFQEN